MFVLVLIELTKSANDLNLQINATFYEGCYILSRIGIILWLMNQWLLFHRLHKDLSVILHLKYSLFFHFNFI